MNFIQKNLPIIFYSLLGLSVPFCIWISDFDTFKNTIWHNFFSNLSIGIVIALLINLLQWFKLKYIQGGKISTLIELSEELRKENCLPKCVAPVLNCQKLISWGLEDITDNRRTFSGEQVKFFINAKQQVDVIAFGLRNAREVNPPREVAEAIKRNKCRIRLICPKIDSYTAKNQDLFEAPIESRESFVDQGDANETSKSIEALISWVKNIKDLLPENKKSAIEIKQYASLPLFFYMRIDTTLYVGPYILGISSKSSITYHFKDPGKGFDYFTKYFENTWKIISDD